MLQSEILPLGRVLAVVPVDESANRLAIAAVHGPDAVQVIRAVGLPAGPLTLAANGFISGVLEVLGSLPKVAGVWTFINLTPGLPYYPGVAFDAFPSESTAAFFEVFAVNPDGSLGARLQYNAIDLTQYLGATGDFAAPGGQFYLAIRKGNPADPSSIVPVISPTASIAIRITGPLGQPIDCKGVRLSPHGPSSLVLHPATATSPAHYTDPADSPAFYQSYLQVVGSGGFNLSGTGSGDGESYAIVGGPAAVVAALTAGPNPPFAPGSVSASGSPDGSGPITLTFAGGVPIPTLVSSDPALSVVADGTGGSRIGGQFATVDGLPCPACLWKAGLPYLDLVLPAGLGRGPHTLAIPAGMVGLASGPMPAWTGPVGVAGSAIPRPVVRAGQGVRLGSNVQGGNYYTGSPCSNIVRGIQIGGPYPSQGPDGMPTSGPSDSILIQVCNPGTDTGGCGKGSYPFPQGIYTHIAPGKSAFVVTGGPTTTVRLIPPSPGQPTTTTLYDVRDSANFGPTLFFRAFTTGPVKAGGGHVANADGNYPYDFTGWEVYPPDPADPTGNTPWVNPPKWNPSFLAQIDGYLSHRHLNSTPINDSQALAYRDLPTPDQARIADNFKVYEAAVASIGPYAGSDPFFEVLDPNTFLVTTATPHPFADGMKPKLIGPAGTMTTTTPGQTSNLAGYQSQVRVLSPTSLLMTSPFGSAGGRMTNTLNPTGVTLQAFVTGGGIAFLDQIELANLKGVEFHPNVPGLATLDLVDGMAKVTAANLAPGLRCRPGYGNENWNQGFDNNSYLVGFGNATLGTIDRNYLHPQIYKQAWVNGIFADAFAAAGRSADLIRPLDIAPWAFQIPPLIAAIKGESYRVGANMVTVDLVAGKTTVVGPAGTTTTAFPPLAYPLAFDEFLVANYISNDLFNGSTPDVQAALGGLDAGAMIDLYYHRAIAPEANANISGIAAALAASGLTPTPVVSAYEYALCLMCPGTSSNSPGQVPNQGLRQHQVQYHPDFAIVHGAGADMMSSLGFRSADVYYSGGGNGIQTYDATMGCRMVGGTGTEPGAMNLADPTNLPALRSVALGAIQAHNAALPGATFAAARSAPGPAFAAALMALGRPVVDDSGPEPVAYSSADGANVTATALARITDAAPAVARPTPIPVPVPVPIIPL